MFYILKRGDSLNETVIYTDEMAAINENTSDKTYKLFTCPNEEDVFLKLLTLFPKEPYWEAIKVLRKFQVNASKDFLIKSYCSKSNRLKYYNGNDLYLVIGQNKEKCFLEILAICTYYEYKDYLKEQDCISIKIKKEILPFYLSLFLNRFTAKDFYFSFKNITGIRNIPIITYNSPEFYIVKNRNKVISYHTSEDTALKTLNIINELNSHNNHNNQNNKYFNASIKRFNDYEEFISAIDNSKIQKKSEFDRYMVDYDWYFDYCISKKYININTLDFENDVFLIRDKSGETISKENEKDMYNHIKENKLYGEDIFYIKRNDIDFKSTNKYFDLIKEEFSHDENLFNYLSEVDYLSKIKIINKLIKSVSDIKSKENLSYCFTSTENIFKLSFFNDKNFFCKYTTSLDYNTHIVSYGELDKTSIRRILQPILKSINNTNNVLSRTDVTFNITNLFKNNNTNQEYLKPLKDMTAIIDVDACLKENKSSCGVVIRDNNNDIIAKISKKLDATTSVEAEIKGAMFALDYITSLEPELSKDVCLRYDCFSVADYLVSEAISDIGKEYKAFVKRIVEENPHLNIYIKKVRGHSSDFFNDIAHSLAGNFYN